MSAHPFKFLQVFHVTFCLMGAACLTDLSHALGIKDVVSAHPFKFLEVFHVTFCLMRAGMKLVPKDHLRDLEMLRQVNHP